MSVRPAKTHAVALTALLVAAAGFGACEAPAPVVMRPTIPEAPERDRAVAVAYPSLAELYQGAQGIYRGCGPNGSVCHNARQYPNMNTLGALALSVNQPCNQLQDDPTRMDDWCERQGDTVRIGNHRLTLAYMQRVSEETEDQGSRWAIVVQGDLPEFDEDSYLSIVRAREGRDDDHLIGFDGAHYERDPMRPNVLLAQIADDEDYKERLLVRAGIPAERDAVQFGDPNRNGVFGVTLGNALIVAGHPERSYLMRRLTDPSAGPLMPLANCCFWSKESLRALWCWIASLRPDGSNAMDPIDYRVCPDGPVENIDYPTPGPTCENGGLCPAHVRTPIPDEPTWANVYGNILVSRCGGSGCHRSGETSGGLDLGTSDVAYEQLLMGARPRVVPGNPSESLLVVRLAMSCAAGASCRRMPLNQAPLPAHDLSVLTRWIANGARRDGAPGDAGAFDAAPTDGAPADTADATARESGADASPTDMGMASVEAGREAGPEPALDVVVPDVVAPDVMAPPDGTPPDVALPEPPLDAAVEAAMDAGADTGADAAAE